MLRLAEYISMSNRRICLAFATVVTATSVLTIVACTILI